MDPVEAEFVTEDATSITKNAIEGTLKDAFFNRKKVNDWMNTLVASILGGLQGLNKPFKYVVTCIIMQKTGASLITGASYYWDPICDGYCSILWENSTIQCVVTVYGVATTPSIDKADD